MTEQRIFHLEPFDRFTRRVVELNALYAPDEPVHAALTGEGDASRADSKDVRRARRILAGLHKGFPGNASMAEQGAFLLRGLTGAAIFEEANFRTAWDLVGEVFAHNGHDVVADLHETQDLGAAVWERVQATHPEGLEAEDLDGHDEAFEYAATWLRQRLA